MIFHSMSSGLLAVIFIAAAAAIGVFGVRMTKVARTLAADTGMGEAVMGAVFIGASTSLSGIIASMTAASYGHAELAVSNALGGIAAQTFFLAIADMFYRKANLEHAAASVENLMMCAFLVCLLSIHLVAFSAPSLALFSVHPASLVLVVSYLVGIKLLARTHKMPMWVPRRTMDTRVEKEKDMRRKRHFDHTLWSYFILYSIIVGFSGWILSRTGIAISQQTGLSEGLVGGVFTAVSTSLPELVIAVTAVRLRSLNLAVGDIIGGNTFDTLFISISDIVYTEGPIYASVSVIEQFWLAVTLLMSGIILMGLIHRQRHGIANIGWEGILIIIIYVGSLAYISS